MESTAVLSDINHLFRQQGLAAIAATTLDSVIATTDSVILQRSTLKHLHTSLAQLVADSEHSRLGNQQLMHELQDCRNSLIEEKRNCSALTEEVKQKARQIAISDDALKELSAARVEELNRHSQELGHVKESCDSAWAEVSGLQKENNALKRNITELQDNLNQIKVMQSQFTSTGDERTTRPPGSDNAPGHTHALGMLSASRERVHQLHSDIAEMRKTLKQCKETHSRQATSHASTAANSSTCSKAITNRAATPSASQEPEHSHTLRHGDQPASSSDLEGSVGVCELTVVAKVINTDLESKSDALNSTLDTDKSAWAVLGDKVDHLSRCNALLQEKLHVRERHLEEAQRQADCLQSVCSKLSVSDHTQAEPTVDRLLLAVEALPTLEKFFNEVMSIVPSATHHSDVPASDSGCSGAGSHRHANWCPVQWQYAVDTLHQWKHTIDALGDKSVKISRQQCRLMNSIMTHIQTVLTVTCISSIVPTINTLYLRASEAENFKKSARETLGLGSNCSVSRMMSVLQAMSHSEHAQAIVKVTLERETLKTKLASHDELLMSFKNLMSDIMTIAGVESPSQLPEKLNRLKQSQPKH